jgi:hypothetical protein
MNDCNHSNSNVFEVDLGELKLDDSQRELIASKIQNVVLQEIAGLGVENDFSARFVSPAKFPDINIWGLWIEHGLFDSIFARAENQRRR